MDRVRNVGGDELTGGGCVGGVRGDCCGLKERDEARLRGEFKTLGQRVRLG